MNTETYQPLRGENQFLTGSKNGFVTLWSGNEQVLSSKISDKAVLVKYFNKEIYAIAEDSSLFFLGLDLQTKAVISNNVTGKINCLEASAGYISYGGFNNHVAVVDRNGQYCLVSGVLQLAEMSFDRNITKLE